MFFICARCQQHVVTSAVLSECSKTSFICEMISVILTSHWRTHESLSVCLLSGTGWKKRIARWEGRRGALLLVSPALYTSHHSDSLLRLCVCLCVCVFLQGPPGEPGAPGLSGTPGASGPQVSDQIRHLVVIILWYRHQSDRIHVVPAGCQRGQRSTRTERDPWTPWTSGQYIYDTAPPLSSEQLAGGHTVHTCC